MGITTSKSFERRGFAAMAALTLAPVLVHAGWPGIALATGVEGDAFRLTLASLIVTGCILLASMVFNKHIVLKSSIAASLVGVGLAVMLGENARSILVIALTLLCLALVVSGLTHWIMVRFPSDLDGLARQHKITTLLLIVVAIYTIGQTSRMSTFMGDADRVEQSLFPSIPFFVNHSCLTAYVHALALAQARAENIYDVTHWPDETALSAGREKEPAQTGPYAPFYLDNFMYPPQFLLLPAAVLSVSTHFSVQRALWFGLSACFLALGFWVVAMWVGAPGKRHALVLIPLLWSSFVIMATLQIGNVHHVVIMLAMLAMIAFERKQPVVGGAFLAFAIVSKLSPALFVVLLLVQRRWRDLAWTSAFGILFTILSIMVFGIQPVEQFLMYELPRINSGEAMRWFSSSLTNVLVNAGPFGIPFKLSALGVQFADIWGTARIINTAYTLAILIVTILGARQKRDRQQQGYLWLGILTLSALQSPFAPGYVLMPILWILTLLATDTNHAIGRTILVLLWVFLSVPPPATETVALVLSLFQQIVVFGIIMVALLQKPAPLTPVLAGATQS